MPGLVGIDSYSYHRLLGEVRPGEMRPLHRFPRGSLDVVAEARRLELDFALLQTSFLDEPTIFSPDEYLAEAADDLALGLSWGAPEGLEFGERADALASLQAWLPHAARLGLPVMRIVAGGPAHRGQPVEPLTGILRRACDLAREHGLRLALENHGDLTAAQIEHLLEAVGDDLRVCFDTANALRVGDDVAAAARRLAPAIEILHLKDCAGTWADPTAGPVSVPLGEGVIPIAAVLAACPRALACIELGQLDPAAGERALVGTYVDYLPRPVTASPFDLTGRRALVTGGGGGIGLGLAQALAGAGARVAVLGRSASTDAAATAVDGVAVRADLSDRADLRRGFDEAVEALGGLDVLVTSHGTLHAGPALELGLDDWDDTVEVNLTSVFELCRLAGGAMVERGSGKIVNVASMLSFQGGFRAAAYAASKGGVAQLTKALANEWAPHGVNVNAIAPGYVRTDLNRHIWRDDPSRRDAVLARLPAARWGEPADLGGAVVFLASAASDYVHGIVLPVDGGWLAR